MAKLTMSDALHTSRLIASIKNALEAIAQLEKLQIAVLSVQVDGPFPQITVRDGGETRKLRSCHSMRGLHNGQYVEARCARVSGCTVVWRRFSSQPFTDAKPALSLVK